MRACCGSTLLNTTLRTGSRPRPEYWPRCRPHTPAPRAASNVRSRVTCIFAKFGTPARLVGARHEIALPGRRDEARTVLDAVEALRFASPRFAGALAGGLDRICARRDEVRRGRRAGCLRRGLGAVL